MGLIFTSLHINAINTKTRTTLKPIMPRTLTQQLLNPRYGLGAMHYTSKRQGDVYKAFNSLPTDYQHRYQVTVTRNAEEIEDMGSHSRVKVVGCYWVVSSK